MKERVVTVVLENSTEPLVVDVVGPEITNNKGYQAVVSGIKDQRGLSLELVGTPKLFRQLSIYLALVASDSQVQIDAAERLDSPAGARLTRSPKGFGRELIL